MNSWQAPVAYRPVTFGPFTRSTPLLLLKKRNPPSSLKTSIMWSFNQLSRILHSSGVKSRQSFLWGFLSWMTAALFLPPHDKMSLLHSFSTSMWYLMNEIEEMSSGIIYLLVAADYTWTLRLQLNWAAIILRTKWENASYFSKCFPSIPSFKLF